MDNQNYHKYLGEKNTKMNDFLKEFGRAQDMLLANNKTNMVDLGLYFLPYLEQKHSFMSDGKSGCSSDMTAFNTVSYWGQDLCPDKQSQTPCCHLEKLLSTDYEQVFSFRQFLLDSLAPVTNFKARQEAVEKIAGYLSLSAQKPFVQNFQPLVAACKFGTPYEKLNGDCPFFLPTYSTDGLGYTFNPGNFEEQHRIYSSTKYFNKYIVQAGEHNTNMKKKIHKSGNMQNKMLEVLITHLTGSSLQRVGFNLADDIENIQKYSRSVSPFIQVTTSHLEEFYL